MYAKNKIKKLIIKVKSDKDDSQYLYCFAEKVNTGRKNSCEVINDIINKDTIELTLSIDSARQLVYSLSKAVKTLNYTESLL